jgi:nitrogen regulatory protein P-II 1
LIKWRFADICAGVRSLGIVAAGYGQMKKIEAVIQLSKLNEVQDALEDIGVDGMTAYEVKGFGRQNRHQETYRCKEYTVNFLPMIKIDFVVADEKVEQAVKAVIPSAKTGSSGAGKVLISDVTEAAHALTI